LKIPENHFMAKSGARRRMGGRRSKCAEKRRGEGQKRDLKGGSVYRGLDVDREREY